MNDERTMNCKICDMPIDPDEPMTLIGNGWWAHADCYNHGEGPEIRGAISGSHINKEHEQQVRKSHREVYKELAERWCRLMFPHLNLDKIEWNDDHVVYVGKIKHVILDNGVVVPIEPTEEGGDSDN